jgi:hypothetical protein
MLDEHLVLLQGVIDLRAVDGIDWFAEDPAQLLDADPHKNDILAIMGGPESELIIRVAKRTVPRNRCARTA